MSTRSVVVLGSTGSIGTQALDVLGRHGDRFTVAGLSAGGANVRLLAEQVVATRSPVVALADAAAAPALRAALADLAPGWPEPELLLGPSAAEELAGAGADVVLNGVTGAVGLGPTLAALRAGSTLALANKESLVIGGALVTGARRSADQVVPVDSEHSAIWQCLRAGRRSDVRRLVLTASGGPFRGRPADEVKRATPAEALAHPTWSMGPVVTVNSASLVNKGLELIEAHLLFDVPVADITVVVHPQSVVHSMVEFVDGSTIAQASPPDMRLPIALGLSWPDRLDAVAPACDWTAAASWTFEPLDEEAFPAVRLARGAVAASGTHPAVYNAANEECVAAFLAGRIAFGDVVGTIERVLDRHEGVGGDALSLDAVLAADAWARRAAREVLDRR
ncbi:1-deoxy-D-xylulose-5-phosphate reductoisomerase [Actinotalea fermentans]|uniref:1-deoxy-D-xylulose 5-phosphate reductoisomerase n=1 Tax=Actinotalea fermentans TaxID=43671 RepID=A0A511YVV1_9CELL|nr:1-deoxy-D-xylulose-5-phosphate reductoisomerase [Actinotalea fermentans]KGM16239.1 1-deoxy-D-xylulose 5-phosphate reductoisomerase [Actinotalea fermentans ATCC 43279 = JCM 9966 = DSM 3133]GEN79327.1 1-deoxy-D-xylulose 5-phosphate reductoisomerase [Actinotalea fermentans]